MTTGLSSGGCFSCITTISPSSDAYGDGLSVAFSLVS